MTDGTEHRVGLRELRHSAREVLARVQMGETIDVTDYGRLIARIVPISDSTPGPVLQQLIASGRATPASRPGVRPRMLPSDDRDLFAEDLADARDSERW